MISLSFSKFTTIIKRVCICGVLFMVQQHIMLPQIFDQRVMIIWIGRLLDVIKWKPWINSLLDKWIKEWYGKPQYPHLLYILEWLKRWDGMIVTIADMYMYIWYFNKHCLYLSTLLWLSKWCYLSMSCFPIFY